MARSVNDRLQDETIAHGLYVNRYGNPHPSELRSDYTHLWRYMGRYIQMGMDE